MFKRISVPEKTGMATRRLFYLALWDGTGVLLAGLAHFSTLPSFEAGAMVFVILVIIQSRRSAAD
ncbi:hypothetical protein GCM10011379_04600 [Filimonas zeae]|uniref:Uncharacterized protein n=2 Tax=Filimonas zeae TaxID=1737353 RepID=A0A917IN03_9BACT|nr:hypothetical protein GCM10011379_04600 [Filimonas zeae]